MATRHQVRSAVITFLYTHELGTFSEVFCEEYLNEQKIKNQQREFCLELFDGVLSNLKELDNELNLRLTSFKLSELGVMERAILRLGAYELKTGKNDARIIISEAIALASEFGGDSATRLVNGVLNNVFKGQIPEQKEPSEEEIQRAKNLEELSRQIKQSKEQKSEQKRTQKEPNSRISPKKYEKKEPNSRISTQKDEKKERKKYDKEEKKARPASKFSKPKDSKSQDKALNSRFAKNPKSKAPSKASASKSQTKKPIKKDEK